MHFGEALVVLTCVAAEKGLVDHSRWGFAGWQCRGVELVARGQGDLEDGTFTIDYFEGAQRLLLVVAIVLDV